MNPSPDGSTVVHCPHGESCGGCPLLALPYGAQLERKRDRVARALARFPLLARVPVEPALGADPIERYRTRAKLVVGPAGVGLYASGGGHTLVDLPGCRVLPEDLSSVAERLRGYVRRGEAVAHDEPSGRRGLRAVDLRGTANGGAVLVTLIVDESPDANEAFASLAERLAREEPLVAGVFLAPHAGDSPRMLAPPARRVAGRDRVEDRVGTTAYVAGPGAFVQAHRGQAARVHGLVREHLVTGSGRASPHVLDLFGGGGGIGLALARAGARVTLVESFAQAVQDAQASATRNGVALETLCADAERGLESLLERRGAGARFDGAVLNPPRRGCSAAVREQLARLAPERVAYVSCDPDTLARDLDHLRRLGYAARSAQPLDMIPLTDEVETVALLTRAPAPHPPVLHEDDELLVVTKWPDEPASPHPGRAASTVARVRGRAAWAHAEVLAAPDEGSSGACALVRSREALARWSRGDARAVFVALARGVTHERGTLRSDGATPARYRRTEVVAGQSLLEVEVQGPGASARVRRGLAAIGHPVAGDARYGHPPTNRHAAERFALGRPFLHVARLELVDPRTGQGARFECPLEPDLALVLDRMRATPAS